MNTVFIRTFKKQSVNLIKSSTPNLRNGAVRFTPIEGNSFRNFKEYRLKVVNQSPLQKQLFKKFPKSA